MERNSHDPVGKHLDRCVICALDIPSEIIKEALQTYYKLNCDLEKTIKWITSYMRSIDDEEMQNEVKEYKKKIKEEKKMGVVNQ